MNKLPQAIAPEGFEATQFGFDDQVSAAEIVAAQQQALQADGTDVAADAQRRQVIGA